MSKLFKHDFREIKKLSPEQFESLFKISSLLNSSNYQDSLLENVIDFIINVINAERGVFVKYDEDKSNFIILAARNINKESISDITEFSSGVIQQVIKKQKAILYHDVQSDPKLSQFESVQLRKIKSVIGVPVFRENKIWGVIFADSQTDRKEFNEENLTFLNFTSNLVSLSLDRINRVEKLEEANLILTNQVETAVQIPDIIGESKPMRELSVMLNKVAKSEATVLIFGESGTGKDITAQAIHKLSDRKDKPFLAQFCGSIPDNLLESELFGYKKGAFTGADADKKGLLEVAGGGTFFLDEIADVSLSVQAKLLRVIENKEIIRLGDTEVRKVDVRLIAASNRDLHSLVSQGKFREDLFYRLNVFPVRIPPLRERLSDIPLLTKFYLKKLSGKEFTIDRKAMRKLETYTWPGNVRQLINVLHRAVIICETDKITDEHLIFEDNDNLAELNGTFRDIELFLLKKRLEKFDGNKTLAAQSLGVSVRWIQLKLQEMNK